MKNRFRLFALLLLVVIFSFVQVPSLTAASDAADREEHQRWQQQADRVDIIRDTWGIPHIYGESDADAVFGMLYAQAEDDFNRIEMNFINAMGRLAEIEGEEALFKDLRMKLFIDPDVMREAYRTSPAWLQQLMDAWADGLNYYLWSHPKVKPKLITHFEPWMALTFSEGSIGGDIETISIEELAAFYGGTTTNETVSALDISTEPAGSNGFAIAPSNSTTGNALLLINPHTSFFFRAELHVVSDQGLNAYGATTWGQFFVYQGFNEHTGWMHTSTRADAIDEYLESVIEKDGVMYYRQGEDLRPFKTVSLTLPFKTDTGMSERTFTTYHSHHGPIIRKQGDRWVSIALMNRPADALRQSFLRTRAEDHAAFRRTMEIRTNSSNNTVFADSSGNIAYYHGNFIPRRDTRFDWTGAVDGSDPATDWKGLHSVDETIVVINPPNGWIQNTNNWPFSSAGRHSPRQEDYPAYMAPDVENQRGISAVRVLREQPKFDLDSLIAAAYDPRLPAFELLLPVLLSDYSQLPADHALRNGLKEYVELLGNWDYRWSEQSRATSLAVYWGQHLLEDLKSNPEVNRGNAIEYMAGKIPPMQRLDALASAAQKLAADFGDWRVPWGEINRYQRINGAIVQPFNDAEDSIPVAFTSAIWGSLASFGARTYPGTKRMYGTGGNSFVAVVEFGDRLRAKAITAGGQSGDPASPHFDDQAIRYSKGQLRDVWFYRDDVEKNQLRRYHPGQ
jgi:acyl-homoserine-lactone acylase